MKNLMRGRPFEKISVSDICVECGINRKSFYYHFRDKYDLVNWIFYVGFIGEMDMSSYQTGWDWVEDICRYFYFCFWSTFFLAAAYKRHCSNHSKT